MRRALLSLIVVICSVQAVFAQYDKDVFYFRGRNALSDGKYAQAIENFNVLAQLDTSDYWLSIPSSPTDTTTGLSP